MGTNTCTLYCVLPSGLAHVTIPNAINSKFSTIKDTFFIPFTTACTLAFYHTLPPFSLATAVHTKPRPQYA